MSTTTAPGASPTARGTPSGVGDYLATQGRFAHLSPDAVETIQAHVDERWELLERLEREQPLATAR